MDWYSSRLGDMLEKVIDNRGKTPPLTDDGIELIETTSLTGGGKFPDYSLVRKHVSQETFGKWFRSGHPIKGDILIATVGANIGSPAIMKAARGCVAQNLVGLRANTEKADPDYLYYYLSWNRTQDALKQLDIGAAQPSLKVPHLLNIEIPYPRLSLQRRIAGILSAYDELIENNQRRIRILEDMARSLYREWFVHFRYPGHESVPLVDSPLGQIPQGWEVKGLFDLAKVAYGKNLPTKKLLDDGAYPVYGAAKIIGHYNEFTRERRTIICGCRGSVGEMQITRAPCFVTNNSFTFDPNNADNFFWLYQTLKMRGLRDVIGGAAQPQITLEGISSVELATPPLLLRSQFQNAVYPIFRQSWLLDSQIENLRRTRDLLLPRLLSGQVAMKVQESELDEVTP